MSNKDSTQEPSNSTRKSRSPSLHLKVEDPLFQSHSIFDVRDDNPAPNHYNTLKQSGDDGPRQSIGIKTKETVKTQCGSPGKYEITKAFVCTSGVVSEPQFSMKSTNMRVFEEEAKRYSHVPGPNKYQPETSSLIKTGSGWMARRTELKVDVTPAPNMTNSTDIVVNHLTPKSARYSLTHDERTVNKALNINKDQISNPAANKYDTAKSTLKLNGSGKIGKQTRDDVRKQEMKKSSSPSVGTYNIADADSKTRRKSPGFSIGIRYGPGPKR